MLPEKIKSLLINPLHADVRVEHHVKLTDFTQWLERTGRSPREVFQRQKLRSILGIQHNRPCKSKGDQRKNHYGKPYKSLCNCSFEPYFERSRFPKLLKTLKTSRKGRRFWNTRRRLHSGSTVWNSWKCRNCGGTAARVRAPARLPSRCETSYIVASKPPRFIRRLVTPPSRVPTLRLLCHSEVPK